MGFDNNVGTPSTVIRFNKLTGQLERPTLLLKTRGGKTLGKLNYTNLNTSFVGKGLDNISFDIYKKSNSELYDKWDRIRDLCIVDYKGYGQFEARVTTNDQDESIKTLVCQSLETELGQQTIRDMHINDEDAITFGREYVDSNGNKKNKDFKSDGSFIPTTLLNFSDTDHSLVHRVLAEKTPHWTVSKKDCSTLFNINGTVYDASVIQRTFTIDKKTPYDFFDEEVSQEFCCIFVYDTYNRTVGCKNLESCVYDERTYKALSDYYSNDGFIFYQKAYDENGKRKDIKLSNEEVIALHLAYCEGIGKDTSIIVSKNKLLQSSTRTSNGDEIKNKFYVSGGDDVITNTIGAANVTGTNYIIHYDNFQYEDMSDELVDAIKEYQKDIEDADALFTKIGGVYVWDSTCTYDPIADVCKNKDGRILPTAKHIGNKVYVIDPLAYYENGKCYSKDDKLYTSDEAFYEKGGLYTQYCQLVDRIAYLEHNKFPNMPTTEIPSVSSQKTAIKSYFQSNPILITNGCKSDSYAHVTSNIKSMIGIVCDSRYEVKMLSGVEYPSSCSTISKETTTTGTWKGWVRLTREIDETDTTEFELTVTVNLCYDTDTNVNYCKQKMEFAIAKMDVAELDFTKLSFEELEDLLVQYNLTSLKSFLEGFISCRSTLDDLYANLGIKEDNIGTSDSMITARSLYNTRVDIATRLYNELKAKVDVLITQQSTLNNEIIEFRKNLDMETKFGEELWKEFCSYVREDEYNNPNYISDGLSSSEILEKCKELLEVAKEELKKACVIQYKISGDLNDIFSVRELEQLHSDFALFNFVRVIVDDEIYKLRLMDIEFSESSPETLSVVFSEQVENVDKAMTDTDKILQSSQSISTSYPSTIKQAKQGAVAQNTFNKMQQEGFNSSLYLIKNSDDEEITIQRNGLNCKSMLDNGLYSDNQCIVNSNGIYLTSDAWNSVETALGRFMYNNEWVYGLNTRVIFGNLIAGEKLLISNNEDVSKSTVTITGDGITLDGGAITWTKKLPSSSIDGLDEKLQQQKENLYEYKEEIAEFQASVDNQLSTLNGAIPTTKIGEDYIISPKIGGGYLYIANNNYSVEIDPNHGAGSNTLNGYLLCIRKKSDNSKIMSVDTNGNGYFSGELITSKGKIGNWTIGNAIYSGNIYQSSTSTYNPTAVGTYIGTDAIRQYSSTDAYIHMQNGILSCKGANIVGAINGGTININDKFKVDEQGNVTLPAGTSISWNDVTEQPTIPSKTSQLSNDSGYETASSIKSTVITKDYIESLNIIAENIKGTTITGKTISGSTISGGTIEGASVNAVDFTAYNEIYMQYKYNDYYGTKIKVFNFIASESPSRLEIGESQGNLGYLRIYPETTFIDNVSMLGDVYISGNLDLYNPINTEDYVKITLNESSTYAGAYYATFSNTSGDKNIPTLGWVKARYDSDERLKTNIKTITYEEIEAQYKSFNAISYKFKDGVNDPFIHYGFKAQDINDIYDSDIYDFVECDQDIVTEGERKHIKTGGVYRINDSNFHAMHTVMIQKLLSEKDIMQQQLQTQQSEIDLLKESISFLMQQYNTQEQN